MVFGWTFWITVFTVFAMTISRRDFLKNASLASAFCLSGCSTLDKWIIGDADDGPIDVLIVGAGVAGLTAAYQLRKQQIPFRLFEASPRIGGRVLTIRNMNVSSQNSDLGAENMESFHESILNLCRELKLPLNEFSLSNPISWFSNEEIGLRALMVESEKLEKSFRQIQQETYGRTRQYLNAKNQGSFSKAIIFDQMTASQLNQSLSRNLGSWVKPFLDEMIKAQFGASADKVSALHWIHWMRDASPLTRRRFYRIDGGTSVLSQSLFDRIAGVIPDRYVKFQHQLKRVEREKEKWILGFQTQNGYKEYSAPVVISTVPLNLFQQVNGWDSIPSVSAFVNGGALPGMGSLSKVAMSFKDRFWKDHPVIDKGGSLYGTNSWGELSVSGNLPRFDMSGVHGILQARLGADQAEKVNPESAEKLILELQKWKKEAGVYEGQFHVQNWKKYPFSQGAKSFMAPGQYQKWNDSDFQQSSWLMAGEALSLAFLGTMNAAVESAQSAAAKAEEFLKANPRKVIL